MTRRAADPGPAADGAVRRRVRVRNRLGLHARPATVLAMRAREFRCDVRLSIVAGAGPSAPVDAKNLLDLLFLAAPEGAELDLEAVGADAAEAVEAIAGLFEARFGTEES